MVTLAQIGEGLAGRASRVRLVDHVEVLEQSQVVAEGLGRVDQDPHVIEGHLSRLVQAGQIAKSLFIADAKAQLV